ncbi:MAG: DEAD/DEAH box helicase family protein [Lachnospiraceae bacterium]|nr:DEAD/DEAH box helicase family protein [Lachnospiraceae bacterium]
MIVQLGTNKAEADVVILTQKREPLLLSFFDRSSVKINAMAQSVCMKSYGVFEDRYITIPKDADFVKVSKQVNMKRDRFTYCALISKKIGKEYIITTKEEMYEDLYHFLMQNFKLPLLKEFIPYLYERLSQEQFITEETDVYSRSGMDKKICLGSNQILLSQLIVLNVKVAEEKLEKILSEGLEKKKIHISESKQEPLCFDNFDDYIKKYGKSLVENLESKLEPLAPLNGYLDYTAMKTKRLYPQQAAIGNGVKAAKKNKLAHMLLNCGMGTGKTIMAVAAIDSYFNEKWLNRNPGKTLLDAYEEDQVNYRVIIMAPSHLVEKWEEEILEEVPYAKCTVITNLEQLLKLHMEPKKPKGRRYYVMSKDFAKLGSSVSPVPVKIRKKRPIANVCMDCLGADLDMNFEPHVRLLRKESPFELSELEKLTKHWQVGRGRNAVCDVCGGKRFHPVYIQETEQEGLICPECNQLLMRASSTLVRKEEEIENYILKPKDFSQHTEKNDVCYSCGAQLWSVNSKNIDKCGYYNKKRPQKIWGKISYYKTFARKSKETAFVMKGMEEEYMQDKLIKEYECLEREEGPRRYSPAQFIKRKLGRGFFDFCILDECHKYEGFGTSQTIAAHALVKASKFTMGLTGTISNGTASAFFSLLFMLEPKRMIEKGYSYSSASILEFSRRYGVVETVYEATQDPVYNSMSKGKQKTSPRVKPGINPVLFIHYLMDRAVFLDLSDMSKYIPPLEEKVVTCELPKKVQISYDSVMSRLKGVTKKEGAGIMTEALNFGLSYADKVYGRNPILSPMCDGMVIAKPDEHAEYSRPDCLLPKEEKLIEHINSEIKEGRNVFVYASYTGKNETNVAPRLKEIIENNCNLKKRVQIIESSKPVAKDRYKWIKKKAKEGVKVFICNPKVVETGVDFKFNYDGKDYNYPTIIFFQVGHELAVLWQASRRSYRLNQTEVSRVIWMCYKNTLQEEALYLMAKKMSAVAAVSGKFSTEGLAALAEGVDPRVVLAQAMSRQDTSERESLENMFDVLSARTEDEDMTEDYKLMPTFYELGGRDEKEDAFALFKQVAFVSSSENNRNEETKEPVKKKEKSLLATVAFEEDDIFAGFFFKTQQEVVVQSEKRNKKAKKTNSGKGMPGQLSLF